MPEALGTDHADLPADKVEAARQEFIDEAAATGKPKEIAAKIADGKLKKWSDEHTLMGQIYIRELDAKKSIRDYVHKDASITGFVRAAVG
jgi:elongation factor Ts